MTSVLLSLVLDVIGVLVFCTIGRRSHAEGITLVGVWETAWPFLSGAGVGWLLSRGWSRPTSVAHTGIAVWVCTVLFGMILRRLSNQGVAFSFVIVASLVTALFLLGWRVIANRLVGTARS
ncbi:membrane protein [Mycobacteroides chelonae]|nr:membrane protein [Mycobacteroides chelonae]